MPEKYEAYMWRVSPASRTAPMPQLNSWNSMLISADVMVPEANQWGRDRSNLRLAEQTDGFGVQGVIARQSEGLDKEERVHEPGGGPSRRVEIV